MLTLSSTVSGGWAATAEGISVSLDYDAAPGLPDCPTAAEFRKEVARHLRRDPFREGASPHLTVHIDPAPAGLAARMEWRDERGEWGGKRTFAARSASCAAMARTVELATAIQIELLATEGAVSMAAAEPAEPASPPPPVAAVPAPPPVPRPAAAVPPPAAAAGSTDTWFGVFVGGGALRDVADAPTFPAARLAVLVGHPGLPVLRLAATGLGPGIRVSGREGSAQLDRFAAEVDAVLWWRAQRRLQPLAAAGLGVQDVRIRGTSAMPSLAAAHEGHRLSGLLSAGAGLGWAFGRRLLLVAEVDTLFYKPRVDVTIGRSTAADLNGVAVFIHGGLLARF